MIYDPDAIRERKRWERERERYPQLALEIGKLLRRRYQHENHVIRVNDGYYTYHGKDFPTLYAVVMDITGAKEYKRTNQHGESLKPKRMTGWTVKRFFGLDR